MGDQFAIAKSCTSFLHLGHESLKNNVMRSSIFPIASCQLSRPSFHTLATSISYQHGHSNGFRIRAQGSARHHHSISRVLCCQKQAYTSRHRGRDRDGRNTHAASLGSVLQPPRRFLYCRHCGHKGSFASTLPLHPRAWYTTCLLHHEVIETKKQ